MQRRREVAHTTVQTTLDRMHSKGYLTREERGKAFVYAPRYTREEFERAWDSISEEQRDKEFVVKFPQKTLDSAR